MVSPSHITQQRLQLEKCCEVDTTHIPPVLAGRQRSSRVSTTHTGLLLDDLQDPLGGKQEVDEAAEAVSSVLPLHHTEELPQDGGGGGAEGSVHGRQGALDAVVQRLSVLRGERKEHKPKPPGGQIGNASSGDALHLAAAAATKTGWNIAGCEPSVRQAAESGTLRKPLRNPPPAKVKSEDLFCFCENL